VYRDRETAAPFQGHDEKLNAKPRTSCVEPEVFFFPKKYFRYRRDGRGFERAVG
jgi:hypothetical protein